MCHSNSTITASNNDQKRVEQPAISFTVLTGPSGSRCTKSFRKTSEGIQKDSAPLFGTGHAKKIYINSLQELPSILNQLSSNQCISTGVFDQSECQVLPKRSLTAELESSGSRSRSQQHMAQPKYGVIMIDYDVSPDMPDTLRCDSVKEVMDKLTEAVPELVSVGYVGTSSSSSGIHCPTTGETYSGGGFHIYIAAQGVDLDAFKKALVIRLWNAGLGYIGFASNGAILTRTFIDLAVLSPERLIYEASPVLDEALAQHPRKWSDKEGAIFDGNLTESADEENESKQLINEARQAPATVERSLQLKVVYIASKAPDYASFHNVSVDVATQELTAQMKGFEHGKEVVMLSADQMVYLDNDKQLSVIELFEQGERYDGHSIPDPIEGPEYGLTTAIYNHNKGRRPRIQSFAHGQNTVYELSQFSSIPEEETELMAPVTNKAQTAPDIKKRIHPMTQFSLTGKSAEFEQQLEDTTYVLPEIALKGQSTVIFAPPNTGKTLLTLKLLTDAIALGAIDPSKTFYINADDTHRGLTQKLKLSEEYRFEMLAPGHKGFQTNDLLWMVKKISNDADCGETIIILDTLKKFMDLMNKSEGREFWMTMRVFISKGGTLVALAHVNKNRDHNGKAIPAGASDSVDDADCAYILDTIDSNDTHKVVEFENIKNRGDVAQRLTFEYSIVKDDSYDARLASVMEVDPELAVQLRTAADIDTDEKDVIKEIINCIIEDTYTKMKLAVTVSKKIGISKRKVILLIEKYTGNDPKIHKWQFKVVARGGKVFTLLDDSLIPNNQPDN